MTEQELRDSLGREVELPAVVIDRIAQTCAQAGQRPVPARRGPWRPAGRAALIAAALCAAMCLGAAAASLPGVAAEFRALFGASTPEDEALLGITPIQQTFLDKNGSGASITVREVVCDQERVFVLADFTAPEGTVLPEPQPRQHPYADKGYWLGGEADMDPMIGKKLIDYTFFADEDCQTIANGHYGMGYHSESLEDEDPTDNVVHLLIEVQEDRGLPEDANYLRVANIFCLCTEQDGAEVFPVRDLDMELVIPIHTPAPSYAFEGRCPVNLGGTTMAVAENLVLSPLSVTMDLIIPDSGAYDAALEAQGGAWPVYALLYDGTRIPLEFRTNDGLLDYFYTDPADGGERELFFRAEHVTLTAERPMDLSQIKEIVFVGDNDPEAAGPGRVVHFSFHPREFYNDSYWFAVNCP